MAPRRKRITKLGQHLRATREALSVDQKTFAAMNCVSERTLQRWENGYPPTAEQADRLLAACDQAPAELYNSLAVVLGIELLPPEEPLPPPVVVAPAAATPPPEEPAVVPATVHAAQLATPTVAPLAPPVPPRPSMADLRAALDAIVYAAAEERDVLPRHLRAFAVELLLGAERLGLTTSEAAHLVAARERTKVTVRRDEATPEAIAPREGAPPS
jgi:transcriptional regulator with XRE-family HTH domain